MSNNATSDTVKLLKECNSGCKTALDGMNLVLSHVTSPEMKSVIKDCRYKHEKMGNKCHALLSEAGETQCDPPAIGTAMMTMGTELKLAVNSSDSHIAEMMADGCNTGIKSLAKQVNLYSEASPESRRLAGEIISEEQSFHAQMLRFM